MDADDDWDEEVGLKSGRRKQTASASAAGGIIAGVEEGATAGLPCFLLALLALAAAVTVVLWKSGSSSTSSVTTREPASDLAIRKSANDERQYAFFALPNGLEVLLVSDPSTVKAAAALSCHVGSFHDPPELPGLAHFLEHMLFMGTDKYPSEDEFPRFVAAHGGSTNAYTQSELTNFFVEINAEHLDGVLDRFSRFFIAPRFNRNSTMKEIHAVNAEHVKNLQDDAWRLQQLLRTTSNPKHPFHRFATGNLETLLEQPRRDGINVRAALLKFHARHYSAHRMKLVVLGKQELDELRTMVEGKFALVRDNSVQAPTFAELPLRLPTGVAVRYDVVPVAKDHLVRLLWVLPPVRALYRSKPLAYLDELIGDEGSGSLMAALKSRNWATALSSYVDDGSFDFVLFGVSITLTENGLQHVDDVIQLAMDYLRMLRRQGASQRLWNEQKRISDTTFRFLPRQEAMHYVQQLSADLQVFPPADVLVARYLWADFEAAPIARLLGRLVPERMIAIVASPTFARHTNRVEAIYGTHYRASQFTEAQLAKWSHGPVQPGLALPPPNRFIPRDLTLKSGGLLAPRTPPGPPPQLLLDDAGLRVWYKLDDMFSEPKASVAFLLRTRLVRKTKLQRSLASLLVRVMEDSLQQTAYPALSAGLSWSLAVVDAGLELRMSGYNDRMPVLLELVLNATTELQIESDDRLLMLTQQLARDNANFAFYPLYQAAFAYVPRLLSPQTFLPLELAPVLASAGDKLNAAALRRFSAALRSQLSVEAIFYGNLGLMDARDMALRLQSRLAYAPLPDSSLPVLRSVQLPSRKTVVFNGRTPDPDDTDSVVVNVYELGKRSPALDARAALLEAVLKEPAFNQLRTREQLGYVVSTRVVCYNHITYLQVLVQSPKYDATFLDGRIEAFLTDYRERLANMSAQALQPSQDALYAKWNAPFTNMASVFSVLSSEISPQTYDFDRVVQQSTELKALDVERLRDFYDARVVSTSTRRKLSIQLFGKQHGVKLPTYEHLHVDDIDAFHEDAQLFPAFHPPKPPPELLVPAERLESEGGEGGEGGESGHSESAMPRNRQL
eukprot:PLAT3273.2.p1 GENE.PLAT3273.2~~PLAT3273.2.p1  ORF type:complete len:1071 (+),score=571.77 PLAT3273.2:76-3288(+)